VAAKLDVILKEQSMLENERAYLNSRERSSGKNHLSLSLVTALRASNTFGIGKVKNVNLSL
jgi:hypothetical protein